MDLNSEILEVVVVNKNLKPLGIIIRKNLFDLFGKPFGREVLENKKLKDFLGNHLSFNIIEKVYIFFYDYNIFSIVKELDF